MKKYDKLIYFKYEEHDKQKNDRVGGYESFESNLEVITTSSSVVDSNFKHIFKLLIINLP